MSAMQVSSASQRIEYPESDGKPMGETDVHRREIAQIIEMLERFFADVANTYISGNLLLYYEEGNNTVFTVPDIFIVKGVEKKLRRTYKLWEEQRLPVTIFEITSRSTRLEDQGTKRALYAMLGVREYFLFDPLAEYLRPPLQGFQLVDEEYVTIKPAEDGSLVSQELGLRLFRDDTYLRLIDIATGEPLLRPSEVEAARRSAEEEVERLRAELARLRGEQS
jgi:Uma2 family endonuclease